MKKRLFNYLLPAVLMLGLCSAFGSCSDDDNKELTPEEQEAKNEKDDLTAMAFWRVAGQLCNGCDEAADWKAARLEANIGETSQQSEATRLVLVNDAAAALSHFSGLIGTELPDYTVSYDWTLDGAGSMTYRKQTDGTAWATVDVDLKQIPGLKRIVYCAPEQQGLNGSFNGTAYYRFGDVIKKTDSEGNVEYWMCVRPMFGKEKKQDMHWVSLSELPSKNVMTYEASTGDTYYLPTKLSSSYNKDHWQNTAEMLFAILNPQQWKDNLDNNPKLPFFNDFSRGNIKYHNQYFWKRVQDGWHRHDLFNKLLHFDYGMLMDAMQSITFIYYGYSWHWTLSWNLELWAYQYSGRENNFHTVKYIAKKENVKDKPFDVREYGKHGEHPSGYSPFPRFTYPCRYATGKELAGFKPTEHSTIASPANGIEDVYVYNKEYGIVPGPGIEPEVCTNEKRTFSYFQPGTVIRETATGKRWICYAGWYDDGTNKAGEYKARFINFDNSIEKKESYEVNDESKEGKFKADNLIPESEAPMAMAFIFDLYLAKESDTDYGFKKACKDHLGLKLEDLVTVYDTISPLSNKRNYIYAFSMAYEPTGGRKAGTQPYMRMVADRSNNSDRTLPDASQYLKYLHYYFYKHYNDVDRRSELLDLTHLFDGGAWVGDEPIEADRWSNCKLYGKEQRNGDFTKQHCARSSYMNLFYTYEGNQWLYSKGGNFGVPKYTDAYFAPVIMTSYMEIDDSSRHSSFIGEYNGKKFELVSYPEAVHITGTMAKPYIIKTSYNGLSFMDEAPFNPIH